MTRRFEAERERDNTYIRVDPDAKRQRVDDVIQSKLAAPQDAAGCMAPSILKKIEEQRQETAEFEAEMLEEVKKAQQEKESKAKEKAQKSKEDAPASSLSIPLLRIQLSGTIDKTKTALKNKLSSYKANVLVCKDEGLALCEELAE